MVTKKELELKFEYMEREFRAIRDVLGSVSTRNLDEMGKAIRFYGKHNFNRELTKWLSINRHNFEKEDI